ncbi:MAG: acetate kinase [Betaproteobacteria bacterium RIFCSPLOWO2_02_FULL_66_14]|nr:MAG: acetate kinase [Betaproteobacteria bacterium RIFCSPLOWO2_02_FULL_66_14]
MIVVTINAGSSSMRLAAYAIEQRGRLQPLVTRRFARGETPAARALARLLPDARHAAVAAVSHRIVHGGERFTAACRVDARVEAEIRRLGALAPLHHPVALEWLRAARAQWPHASQIAVFDTAFFSTLPEVARNYALPRALTRRYGLRRYGFHGLAHEAMWRHWRTLRPSVRGGGRVISLQLGAGCSVAAIDRGRAVDTSMGYSPLEGLVMATRSGDVDPGLLLHLQRRARLSPARLERLLNAESGLLGVSGASADMRLLLRARKPAARLAVDLYCYRARKYVGSYLAALGGASAILVGGGVGEHAAEVRERILDRFEWAGIVLDRGANRRAVGTEARISRAASATEVWVIPVDESRLLAEQALQAKGAVR